MTNTDRVAGDEAVHLYPSFRRSRVLPASHCAEFSRSISIQGKSRQVYFDLGNRELSMVTARGEPIVADDEYTVSIGGE